VTVSLRSTLLCCTALFAAACATERAPTPAGSPFEPLATLPTQAPDEFDRSTRTLAAAVLLGDRERAAAASRHIDSFDADRKASHEPPSGLAPYAQDAENSLISDPFAFRSAQKKLLDRHDLPPELERRVEIEVSDDPLTLANDRINDARKGRATLIINTLSRAVGTSFANPPMLAYRAGMGLIGYGLAERREDVLASQMFELRHGGKHGIAMPQRTSRSPCLGIVPPRGRCIISVAAGRGSLFGCIFICITGSLATGAIHFLCWYHETLEEPYANVQLVADVSINCCILQIYITQGRLLPVVVPC
jgi:hypothetical protein